MNLWPSEQAAEIAKRAIRQAEDNSVKRRKPVDMAKLTEIIRPMAARFDRDGFRGHIATWTRISRLFHD